MSWSSNISICQKLWIQTEKAFQVSLPRVTCQSFQGCFERMHWNWSDKSLQTRRPSQRVNSPLWDSAAIPSKPSKIVKSTKLPLERCIDDVDIELRMQGSMPRGFKNMSGLSILDVVVRMNNFSGLKTLNLMKPFKSELESAWQCWVVMPRSRWSSVIADNICSKSRWSFQQHSFNQSYDTTSKR